MEPETFGNPHILQPYNMMRNKSVEVNRVTQFVVVNLSFIKSKLGLFLRYVNYVRGLNIMCLKWGGGPFVKAQIPWFFF